MKNLFYQPGITNGTLYLDPEESRHCVKVLRKKNGDTLHVTDGKDTLYNCTITDARPERCIFVIESSEQDKKKNFRIHIAIAPTKNPDRTEWFVEKAIEIGVDEISFVECDNSERTSVKIERIEKLAVSAMKQSLKFQICKINNIKPLQDFISQASDPDSYRDQKFIAYVDQTNPDELFNVAGRNQNYTVLIGPEGDFSAAELALALQHGFKKVALGPSRLRTETAGVVACHTLNLINL